MNGKTSSDRVKALRERREALGLAQLNLYADKRDHAAIKRFAAGLQALREKSEKNA